MANLQGKGAGNKGTEEVKTSNPEEKIEKGIKFTFVNHTTFLIQFNGINILTDPIWSERTSPFQWIGPKRQAKPGIKFEDLPHIDFILISHNHYDHLDVGTLKQLDQKFSPQIIVGLGVGAFLKKEGIKQVKEMDWWGKVDFGKFTLHSVPAQHFSGRGTLDRNKTLWCGFVLETKEGSIYFAGDTGFGVFLEIIKERFPKLDLALLPIGAYKPSWFMSPIHISPKEAVQIHKMLNIRKSIATHFGTFALADEGWNEPIKDLKSALETDTLTQEDFIALTNGESLFFSE